MAAKAMKMPVNAPGGRRMPVVIPRVWEQLALRRQPKSRICQRADEVGLGS